MLFVERIKLHSVATVAALIMADVLTTVKTLKSQLAKKSLLFLAILSCLKQKMQSKTRSSTWILTYASVCSIETGEEHKYNTYAGIAMQYFLDNDAYYQPFPFVYLSLIRQSTCMSK